MHSSNAAIEGQNVHGTSDIARINEVIWCGWLGAHCVGLALKGCHIDVQWKELHKQNRIRRNCGKERT